MATNPLVFEFHPDALEETSEAVSWYGKRSERAADDFKLELASAKLQVTQYPERWAEYLHGTRRYMLDVFPYGLVYTIRKELIVGVAVAHLHRRPGYWRDRLQD